jgi:hypothetical protein
MTIRYILRSFGTSFTVLVSSTNEIWQPWSGHLKNGTVSGRHYQQVLTKATAAADAVFKGFRSFVRKLVVRKCPGPNLTTPEFTTTYNASVLTFCNML